MGLSEKEQVICTGYMDAYTTRFDFYSLSEKQKVNLEKQELNHLLFLLNGELVIRRKQGKECRICGKKIMLLHKEEKYELIACSKVEVILLGFVLSKDLCLQEMLKNFAGSLPKQLPPFEKKMQDICPPLLKVLRSILFYLEHSVCSIRMHELKYEEVLLVLRSFYTAGENALLFSSLLSENSDFCDKVWNYYKKVKSVKELAEACHCSERSFVRKFKECFAISPQQWMLKQKNKEIKFCLTHTTLPMRQIAFELNFSSLSYFTIYCKKQFGMTPKEIRRTAF